MKQQIESSPQAIFGSDFFSQVNLSPGDEIQKTFYTYLNDTNKDKVNLGLGAYQDNEGRSFIFKSVLEAEDRIREGKYDKQYSHAFGLAPFRSGVQKLLFGDDCTPITSGKVVTIQTLSGAGAINLGFHFLKLYLNQNIYASNPTWPGHPSIITGKNLTFQTYPYFDFISLEKKIPQMLDFLQKAKERSIIILHACAHNPTGADPTEDQWKEIAAVMKRRNHFPFFDIAYQGLASGDVDKDAWPVRYFADQGFQMFVSQSFAKNMGLYGERIAALHIVAHNTQTLSKIISQMLLLIRNEYIAPPIHGALIVQTILNDEKLRKTWLEQLRDVVFKRLEDMRKALRRELQAREVPGSWQKITERKGMFFYSGLSRKQCEILTNKHHIYLLSSGRISVTGINTRNVQRIAQAIKEVIQEAPRIPFRVD